MSIKPRFADLIFSGDKTVELRRRLPNVSQGDLVVVYVTSPVMEIRGAFVVSETMSGKVSGFWKEVKNYAGVSKQEYLDYFSGKDVASAIVIGDVWEFQEPSSLHDLRANLSDFRPPQSYRRLRDAEMYLVES